MYHPPLQRDLQYVFDHTGGIKQQSDIDRQLDDDVETTGTIQPEGSAESLTVQHA